MITSKGVNNISGCSRTKRHIEHWKKAVIPSPETDCWHEWIDMLSRPKKNTARDGMTLTNVKGLSTISSALIALNHHSPYNKFLFSSTKPEQSSYEAINLNSGF